MTVQDWHAHAQQVDPLAPVPVQPALSLLPPLTDLVVSDDTPVERPDSESTALAAQIADEIAVLTRVLLGLGLPDPEPVASEAPAAPAATVYEPLAAVEPLAPAYDWTPLDELPVYETPVYVAPVQAAPELGATGFDAPAFVAPPVVEIEPLVAVSTPEPVVLELAPVVPEPEPNRANPVILDELSFLDA